MKPKCFAVSIPLYCKPGFFIYLYYKNEKPKVEINQSFISQFLSRSVVDLESLWLRTSQWEGICVSRTHFDHVSLLTIAMTVRTHNE